jgi:hypothetical protein
MREKERIEFWQRKRMERDHTQDLGVDWRILLKLIPRTKMRQYGLTRSSLEYGEVTSSFGHAIEPKGSTNCGEFLD